jgi:hypothetical protein
MSLGKKVALNTGAKIPYVFQHDDRVPLCLQMAVLTTNGETNTFIQPTGLWHLAVCPWPGRRSRL